MYVLFSISLFYLFVNIACIKIDSISIFLDIKSIFSDYIIIFNQRFNLLLFHEVQFPPHKPRYYSFSQPMPSDPASSILLLLPVLLSSAPPTCPSSDDTPHQSGVDAHSVFRQVPAPDTASVSSGRYRSG